MISLAEAIRTAILANDAVTRHLDKWNGVPAVMINDERPPADLPDRFVVIGPPGGTLARPLMNKNVDYFTRQVSAFGEQPGDQKKMNMAAEAIRTMFHRQRQSLVVDGFKVVHVLCTWPVPAPTSDVNRIGRMVMMNVLLEENQPVVA